jgi:hypothetical protein
MHPLHTLQNFVTTTWQDLNRPCWHYKGTGLTKRVIDLEISRVQCNQPNCSDLFVEHKCPGCVGSGQRFKRYIDDDEKDLDGYSGDPRVDNQAIAIYCNCLQCHGSGIKKSLCHICKVTYQRKIELCTCRIAKSFQKMKISKLEMEKAVERLIDLGEEVILGRGLLRLLAREDASSDRWK